MKSKYNDKEAKNYISKFAKKGVSKDNGKEPNYFCLC